MARSTVFVVALVAMCALSGCCSLSRTDQATLRELKAVGISETEQGVKSPGGAAALNILPGIGNFYLASGTDESSQWAIGAVNLLFWPLSITWGIPEAAIDAAAINKKETIYYYTFDPKGKAKLAELKAQQGV